MYYCGSCVYLWPFYGSWGPVVVVMLGSLVLKTTSTGLERPSISFSEEDPPTFRWNMVFPAIGRIFVWSSLSVYRPQKVQLNSVDFYCPAGRWWALSSPYWQRVPFSWWSYDAIPLASCWRQSLLNRRKQLPVASVLLLRSLNGWRMHMSNCLVLMVFLFCRLACLTVPRAVIIQLADNLAPYPGDGETQDWDLFSVAPDDCTDLCQSSSHIQELAVRQCTRTE